MVCRLVELKTLVSQIDRREHVDALSTYRLLGMRSQNRGPFLREKRKGTDISAKHLNKVRKGDFIYSRLSARHGAFGVVPSDLDGCYVSNEFPLYAMDVDKLDARFLSYWFGLQSTLRKVANGCHGSARNRFKEENFERLLFPLPSLPDQRAIVKQVALISTLLDQHRQTLAVIDKDLTMILQKVFHKITENVPRLPMEKIAPRIKRSIGTLHNETYLELGVRSFGRGTFHKPPVHGDVLGSKRVFRIEPNDLVFNNVFAWEGAVAVAQEYDRGRVGSHRFLTCVPNPNFVTVEYLHYFFLTQEGLRLLGEASPGGAGRNRTLGIKKLAAIEVPIAQIEDQYWFNRLQSKVLAFRATHANVDKHVSSLIPAILQSAFLEVS